MLPDSDDLEAYMQTLSLVLTRLNKLGNTQAIPQDLIAQLAELAKDWFRRAAALHSLGLFDETTLEKYESEMRAVLQATKLHTRASSYAKRLKVILSEFSTAIIVPIIRAEGSPSQIAARQLKDLFLPYASQTEAAYIDEAARCMILECHRAAIIMLWAGAMARFHAAIEQLGYNAFNTAQAKIAARKGRPFSNISKSPITSSQELQLARDYDIIGVGMELWKYDIQSFEELAQLLSIRNNAAHPGQFDPSALDVYQFATKLVTYVFKKI